MGEHAREVGGTWRGEGRSWSGESRNGAGRSLGIIACRIQLPDRQQHMFKRFGHLLDSLVVHNTTWLFSSHTICLVVCQASVLDRGG